MSNITWKMAPVPLLLAGAAVLVAATHDPGPPAAQRTVQVAADQRVEVGGLSFGSIPGDMIEQYRSQERATLHPRNASPTAAARAAAPTAASNATTSVLALTTVLPDNGAVAAHSESPDPAVTLVVTRPDDRGRSGEMWATRKDNARKNAGARVISLSASVDGQAVVLETAHGWKNVDFFTRDGSLVEVTGVGVDEEVLTAIADSVR